MNINSAPHYNTQAQSFKAVNIVQVPKTVFKNPENLKECSKIFERELNKITGEKLSGTFASLVSLLTTKPFKTWCYLEKPSYVYACQAMKKFGIGYDLTWFRENTGLNISDVLDKDYHSFRVYTGKDMLEAHKASKLNLGKLLDYYMEAYDKYPNPEDSNMYKAYSMAKHGVEKEQNIDKVTSTVSETFKLDSLDELSKISDKLGF